MTCTGIIMKTNLFSPADSMTCYSMTRWSLVGGPWWQYDPLLHDHVVPCGRALVTVWPATPWRGGPLWEGPADSMTCYSMTRWSLVGGPWWQYDPLLHDHVVPCGRALVTVWPATPWRGGPFWEGPGDSMTHYMTRWSLVGGPWWQYDPLLHDKGFLCGRALVTVWPITPWGGPLWEGPGDSITHYSMRWSLVGGPWWQYDPLLHDKVVPCGRALVLFYDHHQEIQNWCL